MQTFDFSPLEQPISWRTAFDHILRWGNSYEKTSLIMPLAILFLLPISAAIVIMNPEGDPAFIALVLLVAFFILLLIAIANFSEYVKKLRLLWFAEANMLDLYIGSPDYQRAGLIFQTMNEDYIDAVFRSPGEGFYELGNYSFWVRSGKNRHKRTFGFVTIKLPRQLPNILLDATKNNFFGVSNLPESVAGNQKLELEGDFNDYFTLYVPKGYETDALYIFTPDIMQILIESVHDYDCEIVGDELFLYRNSSIALTDSEDMREIIRIAELLDQQFEHNADYYADSRVLNRELNIVAPQGKRLIKRVSIFAAGSIGSMILFLIFRVVLQAILETILSN